MHLLTAIQRLISGPRAIRNSRRRGNNRRRSNRATSLESLEQRCLFAGLADIAPLHSNPSAHVKLYLDFNGYFEADWWGGSDDGDPTNDRVGQLSDASGNLVSVTYDDNDSFQPVFDMDNDITSFSDAELQRIQDIWQRVADDFSPFNVDVTLAPAGDISDGNGLLAAIKFANDGGVANQDAWAYGLTSNSVYASGRDASMAASVVSQEIGHALGLDHQLQPGSVQHRPIMYGYAGTGRSTWWIGVAADWSNNRSFQDDMAVISNISNIGARADDHGDDFASATTIVSSTVVNGIIGQTSDIDVFSVTTSDRSRVRVDVVENLDPDLELYDAAGVLIERATAAQGYSLMVPDAGRYYLLVRSHVPTAQEITAGYLSHGNAGMYRLSVHDTGGPRVVSAELSSRTLRVHFDEPIDPDSFDATDIVYFTDTRGADFKSHLQGIAPVVTENNQVWDIQVDTFPVGGFRFVMGPDIQDVAGNLMDQDADSVLGEAVDDQFRIVQYQDSTPPTLIDVVLAIPGPVGPAGTPQPVDRNLLVAFSESMDANSFDTSDVVLTGPNGAVTIQSVSPFHSGGFNYHAGLHSRNFLVSFVPGGWGQFQGTIGPAVGDLFHNQLDQDGNLVGGEATDVFPFDFNIERTIYDHSLGFMESVLARMDRFAKHWIPPIDPDPGPEALDYSIAKTLLAHTAWDAGSLGPDADYGWGFENQSGAARFLQDSEAQQDTHMIVEETYQGSEQSWQVYADETGPLQATLGWLDRGGSEGLLDHDLDLWITGPDGTIHRPWQIDDQGIARRKSANHQDDLEQVLIQRPKAGIYTIHLGHTGKVKSQAYSLLVGGSPSHFQGAPATEFTDQNAADDNAIPAKPMLTGPGSSTDNAAPPSLAEVQERDFSHVGDELVSIHKQDYYPGGLARC